jgi:hypothetical protein
MSEPNGKQCNSARPEYAILATLIQKCQNPASRHHARYGGVGIRVCQRWRGRGGFARFLADVGPQPFPRAGLRRLDESGHFEPGNVRWDVTPGQRVLEHGGRSMTVNEWAGVLGTTAAVLHVRLHRGWAIDQVLTRKAKGRCKRGWLRRMNATSIESCDGSGNSAT